MSRAGLTGGCQCGAVRFVVEGALSDPGVCHCRMCQKATGGFYGAYVTAEGVRWTRGTPKHFQSSNVGRRGFCAACGTPLTFEADGHLELTIGAFDQPETIPPDIAVGVEAKLSWVDMVARLPTRTTDQTEVAALKTAIRSYQHPDHDTAIWPPQDAG